MLRRIVRSILSRLFRMLFRVRVEGFSGQVDSSRLMIIANHESFLDGLLLGLYLPFDPVFVVHTGVNRNWFFRMILSQVDHLAVDPSNPMAVKKVIKLIEEGRPVVIFPEGRITVTGSLMKVYDGPAFVAARTGATILPVRLDGPGRSYFSRICGKHPRRLFPRVTLSIQAPTSIPMPEGATAKLRRREAGEAMRRLMQRMIFDARPKQTLYGGLLDALAIYGRRRRVVEDLKQIEYSYGDLLKMTLALGRLVTKHSALGECVGILMPNLAATVCMLFGTSTFLANYAKFAHPYDFFRLRYVVAGAEKLSESVRSLWFEKFGIRILEGYGATETAPVLAVNTPMAYRSGTVGQFLPAIEHRLQPVPGIDKGGMLHVRGPNLMSGYYRFEAPGQLQPPSSDAGPGWYETGDVWSPLTRKALFPSTAV